MLRAAYINPQSRDFPVRAVQTHFTDLFEDTLGAFQVSPYVVLCGDTNCYVVTPTLKWYRKYRSVMSHYGVLITVTGVKRASSILATSSP